MNQLLSRVRSEGYLGSLLAIGALALFLSLYSPFFLQVENFINISNQIAINIIIASGMTLLIIRGGIDLSVGANVALSAVLVALYFRSAPDGGSILVALGIALGSGALIGFCNGLIVTLLKAPAFIATLGTMGVLRGIALVCSDGRPLMGIHPGFIRLFSGFIGRVPLQFCIALLVAGSIHLILSSTTLGRITYALGGNERSVKVSGLPVNRYTILIYMITAMLASVGGMVLMSMMAVAEPIAGQFYELDAVAVVVMGGTLLEGGRGSVIGTLIGAILLGIVRNGLNIIGVPANYQQLFVGLIIMLAVISGSRRAR